MMSAPLVSVAVEGDSDVGMAHALLAHVGLVLGRPCLVKRGAASLDRLVPGLTRTTVDRPWIVFRDSDGDCPVALRKRLIGSRHHGGGFELRIACTMTETWLLADTNGFAEYFKVPATKIPQTPDSIPHAKKELLRLCQRHSPRAIRQDVVRADGGIGPLYVSRINEFARTVWDVERASIVSPSLARSVVRLSAMRDELEAASSHQRPR